MRRPLLIVALLLVCGIAPARAQASYPAGSETAASGPVSATLSWQAGTYAVSQARLRIQRAGAVAFDQPVPGLCDQCFFPDATTSKDDVQVRDLDGDGEPEVLAQGFTGGAHCCVVAGVYAYQPASGTYAQLLRNFGDAGITIAPDGRSLVTADQRFDYRFAAYAASFPPPRVLAYVGAPTPHFKDVTRSFASLVEEHAGGALAAVDGHELDQLPRARRGPMAAYVADSYRLGRGAQALGSMDRRGRAGRLGPRKEYPAFRRDLLRFLTATGYR